MSFLTSKERELGKKITVYLALCAAFLVVAFACGARVAHAAAPAFNDANCIRALVGEASGQPWEELYAHACALRNRSTLRGVYGFNAKHLQTEPASSFQKAAKAWHTAAEGLDAVDGRTEWLSAYDHELIKKWPAPKRTKFMGGLADPKRVGETTFYRKAGAR